MSLLVTNIRIMKLLFAFAGLILAVTAVSGTELWSHYKKSYNKVYKSSLEEKLRFAVFQSNLKIINEHNAQENRNYKMGINKFADWTAQEFRSYLTAKPPTLNYSSVFKSDPHFVAPASIDWRDKGAVLGVKDQGNCGGCWAFSTTGALEAQNIIHHNKKISLSEQELLDCSSKYGNQGCDGGAMEYAFQYVKENGISTEAAYPYRGVDGTCKQHPKADIKVTGYTDLAKTEYALAEALATVGPISVAINADKLQHYESGILDDSSCSKSLDHGVLAIGYGSEGSKKYWLIQNSWGTSWGERGYFRLAKDNGNQCGIGTWNTYPKIQ